MFKPTTLIIAACLIPSAHATVFSESLPYYFASNTTGSSSSAPGFGDGSWQANATGAGNKSEFYLDPSTLFGYDITVGQIQSISYWTNKPGDSTTPDWSLLIYTDPQAGDSHFYHSRLNAEPYLTNTLSTNDPSNTWTEWSTAGDTGTNALRFYDVNRDGGVFGTYTDPTLSDIQNGGNPYTWAGTGISNNYSTEQILYISLQTGTPWADGFTGLVDGLTITLTNGDTGVVNLEAAPEPSTFALMGLAALALFAQRSLRVRNNLGKMVGAVKAFRV